MCIKKIVLKCFRRVGGVVNITDPEGGPTATGMILEGGTTEKKLPSTLHRLINGTALKKALFLANLFPQSKENEMYIINMNMNYTR